MPDPFSDAANWMDVFFNGRPAQPKKGSVTIEELIIRKRSVVRVHGKLFRVEVTEVEDTK